MSNSIWKMPDVKPDPADEIVFMIGDLPCVGWYFATDDEFLDPSTNNRYAPDEIDRWAIFTDLIAQADKVERLQKAVDLAVLRLEQGKRKFGKSTMGPNKEIAMLCEIVIDEIKKITQEE